MPVSTTANLYEDRNCNPVAKEKFRDFDSPGETLFLPTLAAELHSCRIPISKRSGRVDFEIPARSFQEENMNPAMKQTLKLVSCVLALTLILSGIALARDHDDDDDYYRGGNSAQARSYGYQNGYRDGASRGRHEGREHDPNDYQTPDWRQATRGYRNWMGPVGWYQRGYQDGYQNGFRDAYRDTAGWNDDWRRGGGQYGGWQYNDSSAYRFGYEDGSIAARSDLEKGKSYNSKPRGRYEDRDHGYRREYGSRDRYKADYTRGYRAGYDANYRY
jgi:hypothetical protein